MVEPFVLKNVGSKFAAFEKIESIQSFIDLCPKELDFRMIDRNNRNIEWEDEAPFLSLTPEDVADWSNNGTSKNEILQKLDCKNIALYAAYQYMHLKLSDCPGLLAICDWSCLGLGNDRKSDKTTLWFGTSGAYTPGHYDTYGCNVVAQLVGSKRWVLFPPHQTDLLSPTRQPYEESSVFSRCSLRNFHKFPKLQVCLHFISLFDFFSNFP